MDQQHKSLAWVMPTMCLSAIAALGWVAVMAWNMGRAEMLLIAPRHQIATWQQQNIQPDQAQWQAAHDQLSRALEHTPNSATLHDFMGALYAIKGKQFWEDPVARHRLFSLAKIHQERSLALRQTSGRAWASLAASNSALGESEEKIYANLQQAILFGPHDPPTQRLVFATLAPRLQSAPPPLKQWASSLYQNPNTRARLNLDRFLKDAGLTPDRVL
jgi:tetratricopeptide (TPR) repeat protein